MICGDCGGLLDEDNRCLDCSYVPMDWDDSPDYWEEDALYLPNDAEDE